MKRIGIDVGGTFTDVILVDHATGTVFTTKVPTTPRNPIDGALHGVRRILEIAAAKGSDIGFIGHGTTVATNLLVEGKGATAALVTTKGFRDVLEIRRASRHDRADLYDLFFSNPPPLVPRRHRFEVDERVFFDGKVAKSLIAEECERVAAEVEASGAEAVAVCLINAPANSKHETMLVDALRRRLPRLFATASCEVNPEIYEYERTSTTVINAMLGPKCGSYIGGFEARIRDAAIAGDIFFMQSNGGLARPAIVVDRPVALLESGPAGGVTAAAKLCERLRLPNAITGDMGGTTFDVSLVRDYRPEMRNMALLHSHAVRFPTIDIESIGAGGGSIAWVDAGGGVHVGPQSAGAEPGPACYGRGGDRATVTDCNLILGYVNAKTFLGGEFELDEEAARKVVERHLAEPLGVGIVEAAHIVRSIANALMAQATRLMTVERGYDPRDFAYICYGGAGPVHAIDLAEELDIPTVIVPRFPGLFSAFGMLVADQTYDFQIPILKNLDEIEAAELHGWVAELERRAQAGFQSTPGAGGITLRRRADCRYLGQAESLTVDFEGNGIAALKAAFEAEHHRQWNFIHPDRPVTLVNLRLQALVPTALIANAATARASSPAQPRGRRRVFIAGKHWDLPIYTRTELRFGHELEGPGVIDESSSSFVFPSGWRVSVDAEGNLVAKAVGETNG